MSNPYRSHFPVLARQQNGKRLVYLDSAATTQKPQCVIDAVVDYYSHHNANPHRGAYGLSVEATECFEQARRDVARFIGAASPDEVVFTKSATESLNALAYSYGMNQLRPGDKIVLSLSEHHANLVPWQQVAQKTGAELCYLRLDEFGCIAEGEIEKTIDQATKVVSVGQVSNALGVIHLVGALAIVDQAQSAPHMPLDVQALDADFTVFSGHKMLSEMGVGVLYGKKERLEALPPFLYGGDMIEYVDEQQSTFAPVPTRFEAGTQNVGAAASLSAAIGYLETLGMDAVEAHEHRLTQYALERMEALPHVTVYGPPRGQARGGIISFRIEGCHPHDVSSILDADGVCIRSGHHCAQPLMHAMGLNATCRASFYLYNDEQDVEDLIAALGKVRPLLGFKD